MDFSSAATRKRTNFPGSCAARRAGDSSDIFCHSPWEWIANDGASGEGDNVAADVEGVVGGKGGSTDVIEASARAYVNALNRLMQSRGPKLQESTP